MRLISGVSAFILSVPLLADTAVPAKSTPAARNEASSEYSTGTAAQVNQNDATAGLTQMLDQWDKLKQQRALLVQQEKAKHAEMTSARKSGNATLSEKYMQELNVIRTQLSALDYQMLDLMDDQLQTMQSRKAAATGGKVGVTTPKPRPVATGNGTEPAPAVPRDQIRNAGVTIARSAAPSAAAVRKAAESLLDTYQPGYSSLEVDQLALAIMLQASQEADRDLREQLAAIKKKNADKKRLREASQAANVAKDSIYEISQEEHVKLRQLLDRKFQLETVQANMMKKVSETRD